MNNYFHSKENQNEPEKKQRWEIIQTALLQNIRSSKELEKAILSYNTKYAKKWKFYALHELFEQVNNRRFESCLENELLNDLFFSFFNFSD